LKCSDVKLTERLVRMSKYLLILLLLVACEDRYRYVCQNPDNFQLAECQKPRCQFTQTCPEYLVAPVLEKKIEPEPIQIKPAVQTKP
jgi:hypothetical protein